MRPEVRVFAVKSTEEEVLYCKYVQVHSSNSNKSIADSRQVQSLHEAQLIVHSTAVPRRLFFSGYLCISQTGEVVLRDAEINSAGELEGGGALLVGGSRYAECVVTTVVIEPSN